MTISVGDTLPDAQLSRFGGDGPEQLALSSLTKGRKVVIFGLPGAFSRTCSATHLPSFMRSAQGFFDKGVEEIICLSVNDPFVMQAWDEANGAKEAGVTLLGDSACEFTKAIGMEFSAPVVGLFDRSQRYAMLVEDGVVKVLSAEDSPGACETTVGETFLAEI
ncbi:MAG: peroxiredoxin [Pelagimonas sp.]|uniref:peroxiredoxin n=1 Tax=Pelagimonas sp. TaxID=2073170 RepID=UPI003D6B96E1